MLPKLSNFFLFAFSVLTCALTCLILAKDGIKVQREAAKYVESDARFRDYFAQVRSWLAQPDGMDAESRDLMEPALNEAERVYEEAHAHTLHLASGSSVGAGFRLLFLNGIREFEELRDSQERLGKAIQVLGNTVREARDRREQPETECYCSCAAASGDTQLRGKRKGFRTCRTLCLSEGYASSSCM